MEKCLDPGSWIKHPGSATLIVKANFLIVIYRYRCLIPVRYPVPVSLYDNKYNNFYFVGVKTGSGVIRMVVWVARGGSLAN
jgi:hypothetical protein